MSYVAKAKKQCPVCLDIHESGEILIHKRLKDIPEEKTVTGLELCKEHEKLYNADYLALVVINTDSYQNSVAPEDADYTGQILHIKYEVFNNLMKTPVDIDTPMVYIDVEMYDSLLDKYQEVSQGELH